VKNGYKIHIVTGSNQTQDIQVNPQLDVSFLKIPKIPIIKSFMLAATSSRKLNSIRSTAQVDITHPQLPLTPNFAVPPNFGKALVCTVHSTWKGEAEAIRQFFNLCIGRDNGFCLCCGGPVFAALRRGKPDNTPGSHFYCIEAF